MPSQLRGLAAMVAAIGSGDRSMLHMLLTTDDLPQGWRQRRQARFRAGFMYDDEMDKRARREKLVAATRMFMHAETRSQLIMQAQPTASEEDARSALAVMWDRRIKGYDLNAQTADEAEVTPPPEAGERARALLATTTGRAGASRQLVVLWAESAPQVFAMSHTAPAELDVWELMSELIQRQRQRFADLALSSN